MQQFARDIAWDVGRSVAAPLHGRGQSYPRDLALLWPLKLSAPGVLKSAVGPAPVFTDTPTVDADGVTPGDGPSFSSAVTWSDGGTLVVEFTTTTASVALVGDVQVFGPLYAFSGGLKAKDGTNVASVTTSWGVGDVVTGVVEVFNDDIRPLMRVRREGV